MTPYEECGLEALLTYGPIILALLIGAVCWVVKQVRRERQAWREACEEYEEVMTDDEW